jgi:hypothetical protein
MSLHINRFIDRVRAAESRQQRDVIMTVAEARDLHSDITRLLLAVEELRSRPAVTMPGENTNVITVEMQGGSF